MVRITCTGMLLFSSVATGALMPSWASAQTAATTQVASNDTTNSTDVGEVVVTATLRSDTVNKVPLSITAITSNDLAKAQVQSINDVRLLAPGIGLSFGTNSSRASTSGDTNISMRGIAALTGAATTGIYLDDIPIYKTQTIGSGFGAAYPKVFDLDRVEVLRGPQGTLFGGSTEGGAIRFITAQPSLTQTSVELKGDTSATDGGAPSYELGGELGGPIVKDVLGFRLDVWGRHDGGWIDHVSEYTGATLARNTNAEDADLVRFSALWSPVDKLKVGASIFHQDDVHDDTDQYWKNTPAISAPAYHLVPAHTYGPYNMFGPGKSGTETVLPDGQEVADLAPRREHVDVDTITIDYDLGFAEAKSITGYFQDNVNGVNWNTFNAGSPIATDAAYPANQVFTFPGYFSYNTYATTFNRVTQEFRLTSPGDKRLNWIAGVYYFSSKLLYTQANFDNTEQLFPVVLGETYQQVFHFPIYGIENGSNNPAQKDFGSIFVNEQSLAGYVDATFAITDKLKLSGGVRGSRDTAQANFQFGGAQYLGELAPVPGTPNDVKHSGSWTPITPKATLSYQITSRDMVYATFSEGYRDGGFNTNAQAWGGVSNGQCTVPKANAVPGSFNPDQVYSTEIGAKFNVLDIAQINASAYNIDWKNVQTTVTVPGCGSWSENAGDALSRGFDVQATVRPFSRMTVTGSVAYDDDHYTENVRADPVFSSVFPLIVNKGDAVPGVPAWTYNVAGTYDFTAFGQDGYATIDYQHIGATRRTTGPGTVGYQATVFRAAPIDFANARIGTTFHGADVSVYVKNLTNSTDSLLEVGGVAVNRPVAPWVFAQTFRPREVGVTIERKW
jgi:iron complex outermembrane receptor protein